MSEVKILPDGSLMNEENCMYMYLGKKINGKPIIPEGVEDISAFTHSNPDIYNEYEGGYYLGTEENPYKYFCKKTRSATSISLHPDTEYICSQAFYGFRGEIEFNEKLKGIGEEAFRNAYEMCSSTTLVIPNGCVRIGKNAFKHNYTPPIVHLPDSITYIGKGAFPSYPPERIVASPKVLALIGKDVFVAKALEYFKGGAQNDEDDAKWLKEIEQFKTPFVNAAIASKNENALIFAISNKLTKKADHDKILDVAKGIGSSALKAAALGSSAKPTQKEREKKAEKELDKALGLKPLSVADIKKLWEYRVDADGNVTLTKYIGKESIPSIPAKVGKAIVTRIGNKAFANNSTITAVYIPEGVLAIGDYAFEGCKSLEYVELSAALLVVGNNIFEGCKKNTSLPDISSYEASTLTHGGEKQMDYCRLEVINRQWRYYINPETNECQIEKYIGQDTCIIVPRRLFGATVTKICSLAFSSGLSHNSQSHGSGPQQKHNKTIESVVLPEGLKKIADHAFSGCAKLKSINIPEGCEVDHSAFLGCKSLAKDKMLIIFDNVLYQCVDSSTSYGYMASPKPLFVANIPGNVNRIAVGAFKNARSLECVVIPEGVIEIARETFHDCKSLKNITLPNGLKKIDNFAFLGCGNLDSVIIPSEVEIIGKAAFAFCSNLSTVTMRGNVSTIAEDVFNRCSEHLILRAPKGSSAEMYALKNNIKFEAI